MAGAGLLKLLLPASFAPVFVLVVSAVPLACLWYFSLRITKHPLTGEIHKIVSGLQVRAAQRRVQDQT